MSLTVRRVTDAERFLDEVGAFLLAREAEHTLLLGIVGQIREVPEAFTEEPQFAVVTDRDAVVAAALRTPPMHQVLSEVDEPEAVDALVDALAGETIPGVTGPSEVVARFAERWTARTGARSALEVAERLFRVEELIPPARPASGSWRMAEPRDRELMARWIVDFATEAVPSQPPNPDPLATADRWIARRYRLLYLWEDGGEVVSLVGAGGATPNGIRIGPVYTPPDRRGRGYATSLTAAATRDQLDAGRRFVVLFTDLANPTSNRIYQALGYRPVRDVDMLRFDLDA